MVGKLDLDLGEDYAFDIRRAREVAERNPGPSTVTKVVTLNPKDCSGLYNAKPKKKKKACD